MRKINCAFKTVSSSGWPELGYRYVMLESWDVCMCAQFLDVFMSSCKLRSHWTYENMEFIYNKVNYIFQIEKYFGSARDIEWAYGGGKIFLLQVI